MITTITGDLLDFPQGIDIIAHSCNCRNTMSAGIAKQIKDRYPLSYDADTTTNENGTNTLSNSSIYIVMIIINILSICILRKIMDRMVGLLVMMH